MRQAITNVLVHVRFKKRPIRVLFGDLCRLRPGRLRAALMAHIESKVQSASEYKPLISGHGLRHDVVVPTEIKNWAAEKIVSVHLHEYRQYATHERLERERLLQLVWEHVPHVRERMTQLVVKLHAHDEKMVDWFVPNEAA